jgi:hypothetical protein
MDELPSMDELPLKIVKMHGAENVGKPDSWFANFFLVPESRNGQTNGLGFLPTHAGRE